MRKKRGLLGALIVCEILILVAVIVTGVVLGGTIKRGAKKNNISEQPTLAEGEVNPMADTLLEDVPTAKLEVIAADRQSDFSDSVTAFADTLTVEQKVAQLIIASPEALSEVGGDDVFSKIPVGAMAFSKDNYTSDWQMHKLLSDANNKYKGAIDTNIWFMARKQGAGAGTFIVETKFDVSSLDTLFKTDDGFGNVDTTKLQAVMTMETVDQAYDNSAVCIVAANESVVERLFSEGYSGVIVGTEGKATELLNAGCDMVFVQGNLQATYDEIIEGINAGTISMDRINDALCRVLKVKDGLADTGLRNITTSVS